MSNVNKKKQKIHHRIFTPKQLSATKSRLTYYRALAGRGVSEARGGLPPLGVEGGFPPPERSEPGFTGFPRRRVSGSEPHPPSQGCSKASDTTSLVLQGGVVLPTTLVQPWYTCTQKGIKTHNLIHHNGQNQESSQENRIGNHQRKAFPWS